ncbi:MAG TPA: dihydrofolate reductase family protein [Steroidobacteraceae bacterium]|nr:dihydrofolate reductase [Gammaproteobacteria bacterium]HEV2284864.1 dihydrofolate reductase family protein [Steroidobacteraceae bacterium]
MTPKVVIDMSVSLDGCIAGPGDGAPQAPLGGRGAQQLFDWLFSGDAPYAGSMFRPSGANRQVVAEMFARAGAMLTGRRTYEIAHGWNGTHPVNAIPVVVLTHAPPAHPPQGRSQLVFVSEGIEAAVARARELAGDKDVGIGGASVAQQALRAGLVDELYLHVAPLLLGEGLRLFEGLGSREIHLRRVSALEAPHATHVRYQVLREERAPQP